MWAIICCLRASSDLSSLDRLGAGDHMYQSDHKVGPRATGPLDHDSEIETFSRSRLEDADISEKGADDHIGLYVSTGSLSSR